MDRRSGVVLAKKAMISGLYFFVCEGWRFFGVGVFTVKIMVVHNQVWGLEECGMSRRCNGLRDKD